MRRRVLTPHRGLSTGIGYYFSGMEEVRTQVNVTVRGIPDDLIGKPPFLGAHSIGFPRASRCMRRMPSRYSRLCTKVSETG